MITQEVEFKLSCSFTSFCSFGSGHFLLLFFRRSFAATTAPFIRHNFLVGCGRGDPLNFFKTTLGIQMFTFLWLQQIKYCCPKIIAQLQPIFGSKM